MNEEQKKLLEEIRTQLNQQQATIASMLHRIDMTIAMLNNLPGEKK